MDDATIIDSVSHPDPGVQASQNETKHSWLVSVCGMGVCSGVGCAVGCEMVSVCVCVLVLACVLLSGGGS